MIRKEKKKFRKEGGGERERKRKRERHLLWKYLLAGGINSSVCRLMDSNKFILGLTN
jgi:hypothetical protein